MPRNRTSTFFIGGPITATTVWAPGELGLWSEAIFLRNQSQSRTVSQVGSARAPCPRAAEWPRSIHHLCIRSRLALKLYKKSLSFEVAGFSSYENRHAKRLRLSSEQGKRSSPTNEEPFPGIEKPRSQAAFAQFSSPLSSETCHEHNQGN